MTEPRKVACLGLPCYGELTPGAASGFFRSTRGQKFDLKLQIQSSSLLTQNMNILWAWALNTARQGRCDFFAMQHADIEPEEFWLDKAVDELEAQNLDVLGVVAPIKDQRGVTSIATQRKDGCTWRVHGRLTMREVFRLPETFTSKDLGGLPLLLNTGLWVCRFDESWCKKVHFTVNDRIAFDPKQNIYFAQTEPEDWFLSRLFNELNLKIGATRKIQLGHRGNVLFGNTTAWGQNDYDKEYLSESLVPSDPSRFPHDAAGWLTEVEGQALADLASGKAVLEIGSYCGRSTICLARTARTVGAVDTFDGRATDMPGQTLSTFRDNLRRYGVDSKVSVYEGTSAEILPRLPQVYDVVFIDGDHSYPSVKTDIGLALRVLRPGGLLAFHDFRRPIDPGVTRAVEELLANGATLLAVAETVAVVRPAQAISA